MGASYSVDLVVKVKNEEEAIKSLNEFIRNSERVEYNLDAFAEIGVYIDNFDDLVRIFLAGWKSTPVNISIEEDEFVKYSNDFDASYGWESVMIKMFEILVPYIEEGSYIEMSIDNDYEKYCVKNGKCIDASGDGGEI